MIALNTFVFFGLLEVTLLSAIAAAFFFWRWRRLEKRHITAEKAWEELKKWSQMAIARRETGGDESLLNEYKYRCLEAMTLPLQEQDPLRRDVWERAFAGVIQQFDALSDDLSEDREDGEDEEEIGHEEEGEQVWTEAALDSADPTGSLSGEYLEIEKLLFEQAGKFGKLHSYKDSIYGLLESFERLNSESRKLRNTLQENSESEEKRQILGQVVVRLEEEITELRTMIEKVEREKKWLEPELESLQQENQRLVNFLKSSRKEQERLVYVKATLQEKMNEMERMLSAKNKSLMRLRGKYETLRREYMNLYMLSAKGRIKRL